jgi:hypothetical protein
VTDAYVLSTDGRRVAGRAGNGVVISTLGTRHIVALEAVDGSASARYFGYFLDDGTRVLFEDEVGTNGAARIGAWDTITGARVASFSAQLAISSRSGELIAVTVDEAFEVRRARDGAVVLTANRGVAGTALSDNGRFAVTSASNGLELIDVATGNTLSRVGAEQVPEKLLFGMAYETSTEVPFWVDDSHVAIAGNGMTVWKIEFEQRSPAEVDALTRRNTQWRVVGNALEVVHGAIHGHVRAAGRPVANATVRALTVDWRQPFTTTTDAAGAFSLDSLPDGAFLVSAQLGSATSPPTTTLVTFRGDANVDLDLPSPLVKEK